MKEDVFAAFSYCRLWYNVFQDRNGKKIKSVDSFRPGLNLNGPSYLHDIQ